jgi:hypothetical protein
MVIIENSTLTWFNQKVEPEYWDNHENVNYAINYLVTHCINTPISRTTFNQYNLRGLLEKYYGSVYLLLKTAIPENENLSNKPWNITRNNPQLILKQLPKGYFYNPSKPNNFTQIQKIHGTQNIIRAINNLEEKNIDLTELGRRDFVPLGIGSFIDYFKKLNNIINFYEDHKNDTFPNYENQRIHLEEVIKTRNYNLSSENIILPTTFIRNRTIF